MIPVPANTLDFILKNLFCTEGLDDQDLIHIDLCNKCEQFSRTDQRTFPYMLKIK